MEQKNWTHVRKLVGWDRYDTVGAQQALQALYADLRLFQNLFQPSMKLVRKVRQGSRVIRRDDTPRTPFERVRACAEADPQKVAALAHVLATTDPFRLSQQIDRRLERLWPLANRATRLPRESAPARTATPWRGWTFSPALQRQKQAMNGLTRLRRAASGSDREEIVAHRATTAADFRTGSLKSPVPRHRGRVAR